MFVSRIAFLGDESNAMRFENRPFLISHAVQLQVQVKSQLGGVGRPVLLWPTLVLGQFVGKRHDVL